jgi:hypothetical protein
MPIFDHIPLADIPDPPKLHPDIASAYSSGPKQTPKVQLYAYEPDEWEEFIYEWVTAIKGEYCYVRRLGGTHDRGIDIAGLKTNNGLEGEWDCFQCKHYEKSIEPAEFFQEILKVFVGVTEDSYVLPDRYILVAPREAGKTLKNLIERPQQLSKKFLKYIDTRTAVQLGCTEEQIANARELASSVDFSMFKSASLQEVLDTHAKTSHHLRRFRLPIPTRPVDEDPPDAIQNSEVKYVKCLVELYSEKSNGGITTSEQAMRSDWYAGHLSRQRISFYCAESLRAFVRDQIPSEAFTALQRDIYDGVIETEEFVHPNAETRLKEVLDAALHIQLPGNMLFPVVRPRDRHGICHQLANDGQLRWYKESQNDACQ